MAMTKISLKVTNSLPVSSVEEKKSAVGNQARDLFHTKISMNFTEKIEISIDLAFEVKPNEREN